MSILSSYSTKCVGYLSLSYAMLLTTYCCILFLPSTLYHQCLTTVFSSRPVGERHPEHPRAFGSAGNIPLFFHPGGADCCGWCCLVWQWRSAGRCFDCQPPPAFCKTTEKKQTTNGYNNDYQHALIIMRYMECACFFQHWNLQLNMILRFLIIWTHQTKFKFSLQDEFMGVWQMYWIVWTRGFQTSCRGYTEAETCIKGREGKGKVDVGFQKTTVTVEWAHNNTVSRWCWGCGSDRDLMEVIKVHLNNQCHSLLQISISISESLLSQIWTRRHDAYTVHIVVSGETLSYHRI